MPGLLSNIPSHNYLGLTNREGHPDPKAIREFFDFSREDLSKATGTPVNSIRPDKLTGDLERRLIEIAYICELVAGFFKGDTVKTGHWFKMPNPMFGNVSPRDMLRFGRFKYLKELVLEELQNNPPEG